MGMGVRHPMASALCRLRCESEGRCERSVTIEGHSGNVQL